LMVILSYRSDESTGAPLVDATMAEDRIPHHRIDVAPLDAEHTRTLVAALLGSDVSPRELDATVEAVVEESRGSPLFAGELVCLPLVGPRLEGAPVGPPPPVPEVVEPRLGTLGPSSRALLELVAVAGRPIGTDFALDVSCLGPGGRRLVRDLS